MRNIKFIFSAIFFLLIQSNVFGQIVVIDNYGGTGDYATIQAAINANSTAIGDIVFQIKSNGTPYIEQINIEMSFSPSIIFEPHADNGIIPVDIQFSPTLANNYVINISESSNIMLKDLRVTATSATENSTVISLEGTNNYITLDHCEFYGQNVGGMAVGNSVIFGSGNMNTLVIKDCIIENGSDGIRLGSSFAIYNQVIKNNRITNFNNIGIFLNQQNYDSIYNNVIIGKLSGADNSTGISVEGCGYENRVFNNIIQLSANSSNRGISISNTNPNEAGINLFYNNMISITNGNLDNTGILSHNSYNSQMYYNSINIVTGNTSASAIKVDGVGGENYNTVILNNILASYAQSYSLIIAKPEFIQGVNCDNNLIFPPDGNVVQLDGTDYDFSSWTNTTYGNFSCSADPLFIDDLDLHLRKFTIAESRGVDIFEINLDIDGITRNSQPDIGADEDNFNVIDKDTTIAGNIDIFYNIDIEATRHLTIDTGSLVNFTGRYSINNMGRITAIGTKERPIRFYTKKPQKGWQGIDDNTDVGLTEYVFCEFSDAKIIGNEQGGALRIFNDNVLVEHCAFLNDSAYYGGGIYIEGGNPVINANIFSNNEAVVSGGAIYVNDASPIITNNIFNHNKSYTAGGGAVSCVSFASPYFINNTFFDNTSGIAVGDAIYCSNAMANFYNNIIWGSGSQLIYLDNTTPHNYIFAACDIKNIGTSISSIGTATYSTTGSISKDPMFVSTDLDEFNLYLLPMSPCINKGTDQGITLPMYDKIGNDREYGTSQVDIGAFEFQGDPLWAYAGEDDFVCGETYQLLADDTSPYIGTWSTDGLAEFINVNDHETTVINLQNGQNKLFWSVTDGFYTNSDTVEIFNQNPIIDAGDDVVLISDNYPTHISTVQLNASALQGGETGEWTVEEGTSTIISPTDPNTTVENLIWGTNILRWTVDNGTCVDYDDVLVSSGFSFYPDPDIKNLEWSNADGWNLDVVPSIGDSVTLYDCIVTISGYEAECNRILVGSGANFVIDRNTKGSGEFHTNLMIIEQDLNKFPNIKEVASLEILDAQVVIDSTSDGNYAPGFQIGSGGRVLIGQNAQRSAASLIIGDNRTVLIGQNAQKTGVRSVAEMVITNGGSVLIGQNAQKINYSKDISYDFEVTSGGRVLIGQNAQKNKELSSLIVETGRRVLIGQNAQKNIDGGVLDNRGGSVLIGQNAQKDMNNSYFGLTVDGGKVLIGQNAQKDEINSTLHASSILINNGQLIIGSDNGTKVVSSFAYSDRVLIGQNAQKDIAIDSSLFIYPNGGFYIEDTDPDNIGEIILGKNTSMTVLENGVLDLWDGTNNGNLIIEQGASFIDMNEDSDITGIIKYNFYKDSVQYFSSPFNSLGVDDFNSQATIYEWNETNTNWEEYISGNLTPAQGYYFYYPMSNTQENLSGVFNTGTVQVSITNDDTGVNFIGNPYPSAIDWETITIPDNTVSSFYIYDTKNKNYAIYQQGGVNIFDKNQYLMPQEAFFVITTANTNFCLNNDNRVHYLNNSQEDKSIGNLVLLSVSSATNQYTDQAALRFISDATDDFDYYFDAPKIFSDFDEVPQIYFDLEGSDTDLAILGLPIPSDDTTVVFYFECGNAGNYSISVEELTITTSVDVYLIDNETSTSQNLRTNPIYDFNYSTPNSNREFTLSFGAGMVNSDEILTNEISIFPNPTTGIINLTINESPVNITIFDITGKIVKHLTLNSNYSTIDISNQPNGIYIIEVSNDEFIKTQKIIKK